MSKKTCKLNILSKSECVEIVNKSRGPKEHRVIEHHLEYASEDPMGFLGEYLHLNILTENEYEGYQQHTYFVKSLPIIKGEEQSIRDIFQKEAQLYAVLLNTLATYSRIKWKPECYLARPDLIVLEDLFISGYNHVPQDMNLNIAHIKSVLKSLASMHASSVVYENKTGKNIGESFKEFLFETTVQRNIEWFKTGVECLQKIALIHPKFQSSQHQDFIVKNFIAMLDPVYDMVGESSKYRNVLCHRDIWRNNILFIFENGNFLNPASSTLVDYQFCRYSPPAIDVLFCLYLNLRTKPRQALFKECLKWYHDCLTEELEYYDIDIDNHVSWESFLKSCDQIKLMPILYNGLAATVIQVPKGILLDIKRTDPEKYHKFRSVDRSEVILEIMERDQTFQCYMFEAVEELLEELMARNSFLMSN